MKQVNLWIMLICLLFISSSLQAERTIDLNFQTNPSASLVGAWHSFLPQQGFFQIVFYSDGSFRSNVFGMYERGKYQATPDFIMLESNIRRVNVPYVIQGASLQLRLSTGYFTFGKLSETALNRLKGKYCGSGTWNIDSQFETVIEFDGKGGYSVNGSSVPNLYWVDYEGVHLIFFAEGIWGDNFFRITDSGNNGTILKFSSDRGSFYRCR